MIGAVIIILAIWTVPVFLSGVALADKKYADRERKIKKEMKIFDQTRIEIRKEWNELEKGKRELEEKRDLFFQKKGKIEDKEYRLIIPLEEKIETERKRNEKLESKTKKLKNKIDEMKKELEQMKKTIKEKEKSLKKCREDRKALIKEVEEEKRKRIDAENRIPRKKQKSRTTFGFGDGPRKPNEYIDY